MKNKLKIISTVLSTLILVFTGCSNPTSSHEKITIGISQLVEHPSLESIREGIITALSDNGFESGENIDIEYKNAQGDIANTQLIAQSFESKDYVIAITTPSAQSAFNVLKDKPIIFSGVTSPESAGLIGDNITGISDMTPVKKQFELIQKLLPEAKTIGIVYNSSEQNSEIQVNLAKTVAEEMGFTLNISSVSTTTDIPVALDKVLAKSDVLYTHKDNSIASSYPLVVSKSLEYNVPIIGVVEDYVDQGALAAEGTNDYTVGYKTGELLVKLLNGENIGDHPYETLEETELIINSEAAKKFGIIIPDELKSRGIINK